MGKPEETLAMILEGKTPRDVSRLMDVTPNTTLGYIYRLTGVDENLGPRPGTFRWGSIVEPLFLP